MPNELTRTAFRRTITPVCRAGRMVLLPLLPRHRRRDWYRDRNTDCKDMEPNQKLSRIRVSSGVVWCLIKANGRPRRGISAMERRQGR